MGSGGRMRRFSAAAAGVTLALIAAPPSSSGAVVKYEDGVGLVYRATRGEANQLRMNPFAAGFATQIMSIEDLGAPLKQRGSYCQASTPLLCPTTPVYVYMSDGDDRGSAYPFFRDAYIWGQDGDDRIAADGRD